MPRTTPTINRDLIDKTTPVRLDIIARIAFPDGSIGVSALRGEARRGHLEIWRIANKDMTTLAEIERMMDRCRVPQSLPASGSSPPKMIAPPSGASKTQDADLALAAALTRIARLKTSLANTSPANASPRNSRNVLPLKR